MAASSGYIIHTIHLFLIPSSPTLSYMNKRFRFLLELILLPFAVTSCSCLVVTHIAMFIGYILQSWWDAWCDPVRFYFYLLLELPVTLLQCFSSACHLRLCNETPSPCVLCCYIFLVISVIQPYFCYCILWRFCTNFLLCCFFLLMLLFHAYLSAVLCFHLHLLHVLLSSDFLTQPISIEMVFFLNEPNYCQCWRLSFLAKDFYMLWISLSHYVMRHVMCNVVCTSAMYASC